MALIGQRRGVRPYQIFTDCDAYFHVLVALGTVPLSHYVLSFSVGDIGLGVGFGNTQLHDDSLVT